MARKATAAAKPGNSNFPEFTKDEELKAYRDMLLIRRFEEKAGQMYGMGLIGGFCHLYIGQEAVVTGITMASKKGDAQITGYRDHGHMLVMGLDPKGVMAELTGRQGGLSAGQGRLDAHVLQRAPLLRRQRHRRRAGVARHRAGLCREVQGRGLGQPHLFRRRRGQPGPGLRELQHGQALEPAGRLHRREQPLRHGHLGRARLGAAPISPSAASASTSRASRSTAWTCGWCTTPPSAPSSMRATGKGPYILEMMTYRYRGHSMSDPAKYRSKDEVTSMRAERDPIEQVKNRILEAQVRHRGQPQGRSRPRFARSSPKRPTLPPRSPSRMPSELWTDIYATA